MKKFLTFAAVAGMAALVSCGGADDAAQKLQDSIRIADSTAKVQWAIDSARMSDSVNKANADAEAKRIADSTAAAWHQDSIDKKLIKAPK